MGKVGKQAFKLRSSSHWRLPGKHHCHILNQSLQSTPAAAPIPAPLLLLLFLFLLIFLLLLLSLYL